MDEGLSTAPGQTQDVPLHLVFGSHPLAFNGSAKGLQAVAPLSRLLVLPGARGAPHTLVQVILQFANIPAQDVDRTLHQGRVLLLVHLPHARSTAQPHLVLQAGSRAVVHDGVGAVPQGNDALQVGQGAPDRRGRGEGPEIATTSTGLALLRTMGSHELESRKTLGVIEAHHQKGLVVLEVHVVARLVALDERVL